MPDPAQAEWLQLPERTYALDDVPQTTKWGSLAQGWVTSCPFVTEAAASTEAARVMAFVKDPLVEERVTLAGTRDVAALRGRVVTITCAGDLAYAGGVQVFCLGGACDHAAGVTHLDVLRRV